MSDILTLQLTSSNGKNRDRFQITQAILEKSKTGAKKTHIMYSACLNSLQISKYLERLERLGCIIRYGDEYRTTAKGIDYLMTFQEFSKAKKNWSEKSETLRLLMKSNTS